MEPAKTCPAPFCGQPDPSDWKTDRPEPVCNRCWTQNTIKGVPGYDKWPRTY